MKKGDLILLVLCCWVSAFAKAQSPQTTSKQEISLLADDFYGVDDFNNLYYGKDNVFYKSPVNFKTKALQFYDVQLGDLTSVDLINPLKILLFYKDTQTVVFLDNRLNENLRIKLSNIQPYRYFDFVGLAGERRLWLFNTDADRVELYDYINDKLILSSPIIKQSIDKMLTDYNFCHLVTPAGIATYNNYGSKVSQLDMNGIELANYDFEQLVVLQNEEWMTYKFNRNNSFEKNEGSWDVDVKDNPQSFYQKNENLYLYRHNKLSVHTD